MWNVLLNKYLISEYVAKSTTRNEKHKYTEEYEEERQKHTLDLLESTNTAKERYDSYDNSSHYENSGRRRIQIATKQTLHERPVDECPYSHP